MDMRCKKKENKLRHLWAESVHEVPPYDVTCEHDVPHYDVSCEQ